MIESDNARRRLVVAAGASLLLIGTASAIVHGAEKKSGSEEKEVGAVEDLMREHGVIRRPILVVTLHQIVRMRRFTRLAAANLRIIWREIIKYAAITITARIAGTPSTVDVNSLKGVGFREPCGAISLAKGTSISAHEIRRV